MSYWPALSFERSWISWWIRSAPLVPTHFSVQWWRGASSKLTSATPRRQRPTWPLVNLQRCQSVCQPHQGTRQPRNPPLLSSFGMSGEATVRRQLWVKRCEDGVFSFRRALSLATTGRADKCDRCDLVLDQGVNWSGAQDGPSCCSRLLRARPGPRAALPYILPLSWHRPLKCREEGDLVHTHQSGPLGEQSLRTH